MILSILLLGLAAVICEDPKVKCPVLSRTRHKEVREIQYEECDQDGWNACFQEIRLLEITRNVQFAFLFASGCVTANALKALNQTERQFRSLCKRKGIFRCNHFYQGNDIYAGTFCCEKNEDDVFKSWLWDVFFGESEELTAELESTVQFVEHQKKGLHNHNRESRTMVVSIGFPLFVTLLFTALALLQFYHINDGIIS